MLPKFDQDGNPILDENGNQMMEKSEGYNVHFTGYSNTAGCIGVIDEDVMHRIVNLYKANERYDKNSSKIMIKD